MTLYRTRQRGVAAVEAALLLPLLLLLLCGMIDGARALQANIIITNIAREGANLVARGSTDLDSGSQDIIYALMSSAPPLDVTSRGMVIITRVMGVAAKGGSQSVVLDQYRWDDAARTLGARKSNYTPASKIYSGCTNWTSKPGKCSSIVSTARPGVSVMTGKLDDGEVVYVVETFYKYDSMVTGQLTKALNLPTFGPDLYAFTIF